MADSVEQSEKVVVEPQEGGPVESDTNVREHKLFKQMAGELNSMRAELQAEKDRQQAAEEARKRKDLEAAGNYEEAARQLESSWAEKLAKRDSEYQSLQREVRNQRITNLLGKSGVHNDLAVLGAISMYEASGAESVDAWFEEFSKSESLQGFVANEADSPGQPRPKPTVGASSKMSLAERILSSDPRVKEAARREAQSLPADRQQQLAEESAKAARALASEELRKRSFRRR